MYQFIKPFLDNKMSIFEGYGAFNEFQITKLESMLYAYIVVSDHIVQKLNPLEMSERDLVFNYFITDIYNLGQRYQYLAFQCY